MIGWHYQLSGHEFEKTPGDSERQESLVCFSSWGHKESDMTEQLNTNNSSADQLIFIGRTDAETPILWPPDVTK